MSVGTEQREVDTVETGGVARLACHAVTFRPPGVAGPGRVFGLSLPASTDGVGHDALPPQVQGTGVRPPDRVVVRDGRRGLVASLGFVLCGMHCETPFGPVRPVSGRTHPRFFESSPVPSEMSGYAPISGPPPANLCPATAVRSRPGWLLLDGRPQGRLHRSNGADRESANRGR